LREASIRVISWTMETLPLPLRSLGKSGLSVSALGLGCMGMSEFYGTSNQNDIASIRVIHRYLDAGANFLDTADMYGSGRNEVLVGKAIAGRRDRVVLATKFGNVRGPAGEFLGVRGDAAYVRECCESSLKRLNVDVIDLYYQHRVDPKVPIEETVGAMAELVKAGKVRHLGLSEAAPATIGCGSPHRGPANRILPLEPRPRGRNPAHRPGVGGWICGVQPTGPRISHRSIQVDQRFSARRLPPEFTPLPGREFCQESRIGE
jgi:hypothetical protein